MAEQVVPEVLQQVWDAARGKKLETLAKLLRDRSTELQLFLDSQDSTTEFLDTALTSCCRADFPAGVELLVNAGCGVNAPCKEGRSPLFVGAAEGFDECVKVLQSHGATVHLANKDGNSPLYMASQNGHDGAISLLLCHGASVDLANKNGDPSMNAWATRPRPRPAAVQRKQRRLCAAPPSKSCASYSPLTASASMETMRACSALQSRAAARSSGPHRSRLGKSRQTARGKSSAADLMKKTPWFSGS